MLRWPTLGAEYITLTTVEVIPSQWANTSKSRLPVICGGLSAPVSSAREFRRSTDTGNGRFGRQIKVFPLRFSTTVCRNVAAGNRYVCRVVATSKVFPGARLIAPNRSWSVDATDAVENYFRALLRVTRIHEKWKFLTENVRRSSFTFIRFLTSTDPTQRLNIYSYRTTY